MGKVEASPEVCSSRENLPKSEFEEATRNSIVAFLVAFAVLTELGLFPSLRAVVWSVIMSFLLFEAAMSKLAREGLGFSSSPSSQSRSSQRDTPYSYSSASS